MWSEDYDKSMDLANFQQFNDTSQSRYAERSHDAALLARVRTLHVDNGDWDSLSRRELSALHLVRLI
jgi:hypothetical protein